jgi:acetyl esterase/lipase
MGRQEDSQKEFERRKAKVICRHRPDRQRRVQHEPPLRVTEAPGGNLTLATLISLREAGDPLPAGAVCLSPITDLEGTGDSFTTKNDPAASSALALSMATQYAGNQDMRAPLLSPHYGDLRGLPPLLIQVGGDEILLSDATRLADNARAAGVDVNLVIWPKMWHAWQLFVPHLPGTTGRQRHQYSLRDRTTALQK